MLRLAKAEGKVWKTLGGVNKRLMRSSGEALPGEDLKRERSGNEKTRRNFTVQVRRGNKPPYSYRNIKRFTLSCVGAGVCRKLHEKSAAPVTAVLHTLFKTPNSVTSAQNPYFII